MAVRVSLWNVELMEDGKKLLFPDGLLAVYLWRWRHWTMDRKELNWPVSHIPPTAIHCVYEVGALAVTDFQFVDMFTFGKPVFDYAGTWRVLILSELTSFRRHIIIDPDPSSPIQSSKAGSVKMMSKPISYALCSLIYHTHISLLVFQQYIRVATPNFAAP